MPTTPGALASLAPEYNSNCTTTQQIEDLTQKPLTGRNRANLFYFISFVHSDDISAMLGRYLFDDRNPDLDLIEQIGSDDGLFVTTNGIKAAEALATLLPSASPTTTKVGRFGPQDVEKWRRWWKANRGEMDTTSVTPTLQSPTIERFLASSEASVDRVGKPTRYLWWLLLGLAVASAVAIGLHHRHRPR